MAAVSLRRSVHFSAAAIALSLQVPGWAATAARAPATPPSDSDWIYRIQPGDTLIALTAAYLQPGHHWRELQRLNKVANPLRLPPGGALRMPLAWLAREAAVAEVFFVKGQVLLRREGAAEQPLQMGMSLRSGDALQSASQSSASLRFADGSRLLIPPDTVLTLEQLLVYGRSAIPAVQLRLQRGGADSQVRPNPGRLPLYEVRTPSANLGVRGTEFRVQVADAAHTRMEVLQGAVGASAGKAQPELRVAAGQGLLAQPGQALHASPLPAAPSTAGLPALLERVPLRLAWAGQAGASAWRAQVFAHHDVDRLLLDSLSPEPQVRWDELPDGDYTLRLRAVDAQGLEGLASDHDFRLKARPEPPLVQAPAAQARLYGERVELRWTQNTAARAYRLQLAQDVGFTQLQQDLPALSGASHTLSLPPGRYHWRLAALAADAGVFGGEQGPFGDAQQFELRPLPPAPPPAEPQLDGDHLQLRWGAQAGVARYELQLADDERFTLGLQTLNTEQAAISLPRPAHGRHYLRLRGFDADGQAGPWGQVQLIEVPWPRWPWLLPLLLLLH
ncbi:FecR domain-containing protein [Paucibacter sp. APW11]|uniref:FecR domain-containing protein n=1 Tax=Roseateles aquae TaxID=3077235 RepID=A0ABU3PDT0_9BURK|nr:FecR domain-containing protein [Paucibacter sp. APW11]MDT9000737.1 FecR domain-containing protein [Paucibacter sp. APW11]